jgi:hypothetical protein
MNEAGSEQLTETKEFSSMKRILMVDERCPDSGIRYVHCGIFTSCKEGYTFESVYHGSAYGQEAEIVSEKEWDELMSQVVSSETSSSCYHNGVIG